MRERKDGDTGEEQTQRVNIPRGNQVTKLLSIINMSSPFYNLRLIKIERREVTVKKSFEKREAVIGGVMASLRGCSHAFSLCRPPRVACNLHYIASRTGLVIPRLRSPLDPNFDRPVIIFFLER